MKSREALDAQQKEEFLGKTLEDWQIELEKCKDPVYFYENYVQLRKPNGTIQPRELSESDKENMRAYAGFIKT